MNQPRKPLPNLLDLLAMGDAVAAGKPLPAPQEARQETIAADPSHDNPAAEIAPQPAPERTRNGKAKPAEPRAVVLFQAEHNEEPTEHQAETEDEPANLSEEVASLRAQIARTLASHEHTITERDRARRELAAAERELVILRNECNTLQLAATIDRTTKAQEGDAGAELARLRADLDESRRTIDAQARSLEKMRDEPKPATAPAKVDGDRVAIAFAKGEQTAKLRAAGLTVDDLRAAGFRWTFNDRRDTTAGGCWTAERTCVAVELARALGGIVA